MTLVLVQVGPFVGLLDSRRGDRVRVRPNQARPAAAVRCARAEPQDPARPADTRVLLIKVELTEPAPLKLGQRVAVEVAR